MMHTFVLDPCQIAAYFVDIEWLVAVLMHNHFGPSKLNSFALMDAKHFHREESVVIYHIQSNDKKLYTKQNKKNQKHPKAAK